MVLSSQDLDLLGKVVLAAVIGFAIGWEREFHGHPAGTRTLALICLAAAILTGLGMQMTGAFPDRVVQGIAQGVGVLGAGLVIHARQGGVQGLTTAVSMWTTASIGVIVGSGHPLSAILITCVTLILLWGAYLPILRNLHPHAPNPSPDQGGAAPNGQQPSESPADPH